MEYRALTSFKVKQQGQVIEIKSGQIITLPDDKGKTLMAKGLVKPEFEPSEATKIILGENAGRINSEVLQDHLWAVESKKLGVALRSQGITGTIYTHKELENLKRLPKQGRETHVKNLHVLKEAFKDSVEEIFVSDKVNLDNFPEGIACYTTRELQVIADLKAQPSSLNFIHEAKKIFDNGTIARGEKKR